MAENIDWGSVFTSLANGGISLYDALGHGGTTDMGVAKDAAALADPFASQRPQYQQMLSNLFKDPSSIRDTPGYQFGMNQGLDAIKGAGNAIYGGTRAGAIYPELAKFATGYADNSFHNRVGELMQMAGVNAGSPGTAGLLLEKGGENQNASLGSGVADIFKGLFGQNGAGPGLINAVPPLISLISKYLNPSGGNPFDGSNFGKNDRGIGQDGALPLPDPYNSNTYGTPDYDSLYGGGSNPFNSGTYGSPDYDNLFGSGGGDFDLSQYLSNIDF